MAAETFSSVLATTASTAVFPFVFGARLFVDVETTAVFLLAKPGLFFTVAVFSALSGSLLMLLLAGLVAVVTGTAVTLLPVLVLSV